MRDYVGSAAIYAVLYGGITYFVTAGELRFWLPVIPFAFATHLSAAMIGRVLKLPPRSKRSASK